MYGKLCIAGIILFLGILFFLPYNQRGLVLFILVPCLMFAGMVLSSEIRGFFWLLLVPVFCLLIWVTLDPEEIFSDHAPVTPSPQPSMHLIFMLAGAFVALLLLADRGRIWKKKIGVASFLVCSLIGLTLFYVMLGETFTNIALDHSTKHFVLPITEREWEVKGHSRSGLSMHEWITIDPPGDIKAWPLPVLYDVGSLRYVWMHNARNLCIDAGDGAWGDKWYRIKASCP